MSDMWGNQAIYRDGFDARILCFTLFPVSTIYDGILLPVNRSANRAVFRFNL